MTSPAHASPARAIPLRIPTPAKAVPSAKGLLRLVPQRRSQAAKTPFAVVLVVLLVGGLLGLLMLNMMVAQGSFTLHDLAQRSHALQLQEQQLAGQVDAVQAPSQLATRATQMGMVPGGAPAFLRLPDGVVLGAPSAQPAPTHPAAPAPAAATRPSPAAAAVARPTAPVTGSTTWTSPKQTSPRRTPPPTSQGAHG